ncbi:type VI secretion system membrane subunit TssM [Xenorhabdus sp. IM139775]|uniref:type VI secretion system membrane subunit TssM n=1 Tax=Xenorhabdus sp. IM139775 TaxID=3025876 RepID=UPI0023594995|nr:type VI secretion system membrane subunit TssM [Xenorhabdus sp. IM139775]MDC9593285.1 type VI secretion system membrane subunit TssM [Xenorhabdus sp. IM139775]
MLNALFALITSRLTWSFIGTLLFSLVIWFIGPMTSVGNSVPFASMTTRIITIVILFVTWLFTRLLPRFYQSWINQKLTKQLNITKDDNEENKQIEHPITLAERFSDAARLLKRAYFSGLYSKNKPGWINFFNRQYIYQLPWYLVIGAPHSGKTTALANSGLHFPLSDYFGKSALYSMQGRDSCNWWFTNKAVLLDTTGRYTTQDSVQQQDADEWKNLIRLLKKYRIRQPLNGVIMTISVEDLLNPSTEKRDQQAYMLRRRLSELHEQLKIRLPIYIMVTKTDLLKGFSAYFAHFDKKSREQIWGFNFPWESVPQGKWHKNSQVDLNEIFEQQYSQLQLRLEAELPSILLNGHNARQCAESYLFPQEVASLRLLIAQYLDIVFAKSGFEIPYYPRGLYFTSGTQEGIPFDNVMEKFNHVFQLPTDNNSHSMSWVNDKGIIHPTPTRQTYFLKNLLDNIFLEAGIAGYNRWWIYRKRVLSGLGYIISVAILALMANLLLTSYSNNKDYLLEVQAKIPAIVKQGVQLKNDTHDIYALLPILNSLAYLDKSQHFSLADPPLSYRMGLYSGEQIHDASQSLYRKALQTLLLPQIATMITSQMHDDHGEDAEKSYNTLKAYQMLYQPEHYDGQFLHDWSMQYLKTHLNADTTQQQLQQIEEHIGQLLDNQVVTSPFIRDDALVEKKQALISRLPPAQRAYHYLKEKLMNDPDLSPVNLDTLAGPQAELAFSRISDAPMTEGIAGMFTPAGYQKGIGKDLNTFLTTLYSQDNWVLGTYANNNYANSNYANSTYAKKQTDKEIKYSVKQFYINDYLYQWNKFLADIRLRNIDSLEQRASTARLLSSFDSPMRNLLINISKNVTLNENNQNIRQLNNIMKSDIVKNQSNKLTSKLVPRQISKSMLSHNDQSVPEPEQAVEEHFAPIIELAKKANKNSPNIPFDKTLKEIGELYLYLTAVQNATNTGMPLPDGKIITQLQTTSELLPMPFRSMVSSLAVGASHDTQLSDMRNVGKHLNAEIGVFCNQAIARRYPLTPNARQDIKPDDMARMFAPDTGLMDSFFQKTLAGKVDTLQPTWQFMPGVNGKSLPGGKALLRPFQQAQIIRDTLFTAGTPTPLFHVMVRPVSMDNEILSMILDVDGQKIEYSHGPPLSQLISWPGPAKTNRVRIQLNLSDGTTANLSASGFWALNRLLDQAKRTWLGKTGNSTGADDTSLRATFNISGRTVLLEFTPNSIFSPFHLPVFSCPSAERFQAA